MKRMVALMGALTLVSGMWIVSGCQNSPGMAATEPPTEGKSDSAVTVVGHGAEVTLEEHVVAGKTTVFDFYSEECPACMMLAPELDKLAAKRPDLAIVKVDVNRPEVKDRIDWDSPVARQHRLEALPHLVIFDAEGKQVASGEEAFAQVTRWMDQ